MKKVFFLATAAVFALASCTNNDFVGDNTPTPTTDGQAVISFGSGVNIPTRADHVGADAAGLLNNNFVVEGIKTVSGSVVEVFDNYNVNWAENTADKTLSNTHNWEYVGQNILTGKTAISEQTIKYWDYAASQYDFWAYSLGGGSATVSTLAHDAKLTSSAYTFTGSANDLAKVYISNLVTAYNPNITVTNQPKYKNVVTMKFRALVAKIRIGLYETIPGYSVKEVKFYPAAGGTAATTAALYASDAVLPSSGVCTVYFPTVGQANVSSPDYNKAHISFASEGTKAANQTYGTLSYGPKEKYEKTTGNIWLARTSAQPTWAVPTSGSAGDYVTVLPNETGSVLTLKVDYTLESIDGSGETITIHGATANIPSQYTQWKSNFAYTYIFKISDNTNGKTDVTNGPEGLYPITFDAVVIDSQEDTQETITTVDTPSITTYSVTSGVTNNNEYSTKDVVYVTVTEDGSLLDMTGKATLYTVSKQGATEAEVIEALNTYVSNTSGTYVGRNEITLTPVTDGVGLTETEIPLVDSNKITGLTAGTVGKLKEFTTAGTYAFVYTKTAATTSNPRYQEVTKNDGESVEGLYTYDSTNNTYTAATGTAVAGTKYYTKYTEDDGIYAVKVIKVQ